jgi:hypothetical protein
MKITVKEALIVCGILALFIGILPAAIVFFLGFGWFLVNKKGEKIF